MYYHTLVSSLSLMLYIITPLILSVAFILLVGFLPHRTKHEINTRRSLLNTQNKKKKNKICKKKLKPIYLSLLLYSCIYFDSLLLFPLNMRPSQLMLSHHAF